MSKLMQKLSSRKLWIAVIGIAIGAATALGVDMESITSVAEAVAGAVQAVVGAGVAVASIVSYIRTEGKIDAAAVQGAVTAVQDAVSEVQEAVTEIQEAE